jgi:hypothetical protein
MLLCAWKKGRSLLGGSRRLDAEWQDVASWLCGQPLHPLQPARQYCNIHPTITHRQNTMVANITSSLLACAQDQNPHEGALTAALWVGRGGTHCSTEYRGDIVTPRERLVVVHQRRYLLCTWYLTWYRSQCIMHGP